MVAPRRVNPSQALARADVHRDHVTAARLARAAVASLHAELVLAPKPGLVCPGDAGSHRDMDATTMLRGLAASRHGFRAIAVVASAGATLDELRVVGIAAERRMLAATRGVNTHRGALFAIGLLTASAAACVAQGVPLDDASLRAALRARWGRALAAPHCVREVTHGAAMAARHEVGGARGEAADAYPTVFEHVLPALRLARAAGCDERGARLHALMTAIAIVDDTNLFYRGGAAGAMFAKDAARDFLAAGGVFRADRDAALDAIGASFVALRLSPGGSADLLAAALFVDRINAGSIVAS